MPGACRSATRGSRTARSAAILICSASLATASMKASSAGSSDFSASLRFAAIPAVGSFFLCGSTAAFFPCPPS